VDLSLLVPPHEPQFVHADPPRAQVLDAVVLPLFLDLPASSKDDQQMLSLNPRRDDQLPIRDSSFEFIKRTCSQSFDR
jgi:hypothetical protein